MSSQSAVSQALFAAVLMASAVVTLLAAGDPVRAQTCPGAEDAPTPTDVAVTSVPIVVESTAADYFVLYASHDVDGETVWYPVKVALGEEGTTTLAENVAPLPAERYRVEKYLIADPADVDGDCTDDITELNNLGAMNPVNPAVAVEGSEIAVALPDPETFETLAYHALSGGLHVNVSIFNIDTDRPSIYFQDTNRLPYHRDLLSLIEDPGGDSSTTLNGAITYHPELVAPDGSSGVYLLGTGLRLVGPSYTLISASMPVLENNLVLWIRNRVLSHYRANLPLYRQASRMNLVFDEDVFPETTFQALNPGEGYGLLRSLEPDERPGFRDVVIYETLPNELPRVAGIISTVPQTPLSHVNLRALQDGVPNAFIADALDDDDISGLIGSHVHYAVSDNGYSIRAATQAEVDEHYASSRPSETQTPARDLSVTTITPLSDIGFDDWDSFGVKAANVAVLRTLGFPEGTVPDGFAVPFYFYDEFMKHNGFYDDIEEMLADPEFQSDYDTKVDELKKLRKKIKKAETPEWIETALTEMHATFPEGAPLRYRSSTNNEDLPNFNGAGLYDSKTQHPEETEEDGIAKSLKQVYASLWNFRAFIERDFHRIDHLAAAMGVLVHPNYSDELVNGVAVSTDPAYGTESTHYVNSQVGEDLVTNPDAHSVPEEVLLYSGGTYDVIALSNQVPQGQLLMTDDQLGELRRHLAMIHTKFAELYSVGEGAQFAMEIEFKITSDNILAIKQARPWIFAGAPPEIDISSAENPGVALTASFEDMPETHYGSPFDFKIQFSEVVSNSNYEAPDAVTITGGRVTRAFRLGRNNDLWNIRVRPDSSLEDVTLVLPDNRSCSVRGAICTFGGRRLSNRLEHTVESLPPRVPGRPAGTALSSDSVQLRWNDAARAESYEVQLRQSDQWIDLPANGTEIEFDGDGAMVSGLPDSDFHYLRVRAVNFKGASAWSESLFMPMRLDWESELTAGQRTDVLPVESGYARFGELGGSLSPDEFVLDGTTYKVQFLVHASESLWLGTSPELPADFTLVVGDSIYRGSESVASATMIADAGYWWPSATPNWHGDNTVQAGLLIHPEIPLGERRNAPVTGYFHAHPAEHDGSRDFSFRIHFSEDVAATADALRDHVLSVAGGTVSSVELIRGEGRIWTVSVTPEGHRAVTVEIEADVDCQSSAAICSADGRRLYNRMELTVEPRDKNPPIGSPTISGVLEVGETLTADTSGIADPDGLTNATFGYQWVSYDGNANTDIQGATSSTYTLVQADEGKAFKVRVSFTDDAGNKQSLTSELFGSDRPYGLNASESDGAVVLTWELPGGWPYSSLFQILRNRPELGETESLVHARYLQAPTNTYTDTDVEPGVLYVYRVTGVDPFGYAGGASRSIEIRTRGPEPVENSPATGAPTISGPAHVGETLTADTSSIADPDGLTNATFDHQWLADSAEVSGATNSTYTLSDDDLGRTITVRVSFTDDAGNEESLTSQATETVTHLIWSSTLTVESADGQSGYSLPQGMGVLAPVEFTIGVADFIVRQVLTGSDGTLTLGLDWELSGPFTVHAGTVSFAFVEAQRAVAEGGSGYTYRWDDAGLDWTAGENLGLRLTSPERPLTAVLEAAPGSHDGQNGFTFELRFSEEPSLSYKTLRDHAFSVTGGAVIKARRVAPPSNLHWEITVLPNSNGDAVIALPPTTDCSDEGAVCTASGKMLSNAAAITVPGPAAPSQQQAENSPAAGKPTITGTPTVGETLSVSMSAVTDLNGISNATYSYQWLADDANIQDATGSTYTLVDNDEGKAIKAQVSFTDDDDFPEQVTSEATAPVAPRPNRPATGSPSIQGVLEEGRQLTADTAGIADADGLTNPSLAYRWMRVANGAPSPISGQTAATYTLTANDVGRSIQLKVSFTDDRGAEESLTSAATPEVVASGATRNLLWLSTITVEDKDNLGTDFGFDSSVDVGGLSPAVFTEGGNTHSIASLIAAFNEPATLAVDLDLSPTTEQVAAWVLNLHGAELPFSDATATETSADPPHYRFAWDISTLTLNAPALWRDSDTFSLSLQERFNLPTTGASTIDGTAQEGETLTANITGIADPNGMTASSYSYQWSRGDSPIDGATASTYTVVADDRGHNITVAVSFIDDDGFDESVASRPVSIPLPPLTAGLVRTSGTPANHDGSTAFTIRLDFSEHFSLSYRTVQDHALNVTNGAVTSAARVDPDGDERNRRWTITIRPSNTGDVEVSINATTDCDDEGAICISDGRKLSSDATLTITKP